MKVAYIPEIQEPSCKDKEDILRLDVIFENGFRAIIQLHLLQKILRKLLGNHDEFEIGRCCYHFDFSHFEKKIISGTNLINGAALQ